MLPYLENEYASMDPDLLDREIDNLLAGTDGMEPDFANDDDFEAYESFLSSVPDDAVVSFPGADAYDDDEVMEDVAFARPTPFDSFDDDDSVTIQESPISDFFGMGILRDSFLDEEMASLDLSGATADPEVEFLTAALARLTLTSHVGNDITMEQQPPKEDVAMVVLQGPIPPATVVVDMAEPEEPAPLSTVVEMAEPEEAIPPVTVVDMTEPEEPVPPTSNPTELNGSISPAFEVIPVTESAQPEEPTPDVGDIVPDAVPDSPQSASPPRWPSAGEGEEDWRGQSAWSDDDLFSQPPSRPFTPPRREAEIRPGISPGSSLEEEMICALLGIAPGNLSRSPSRSPSPASDNEDAPLWAFPPGMADIPGGATSTNLSLNDLFDLRQQIEPTPLWAFPPEMAEAGATNRSLNDLFRTSEGNPTTEGAADEPSTEEQAPADPVVPGPEPVAEAQEPTPEDQPQVGSSESPDDDKATLAPGEEVAEEQPPATETPAPANIPEIVVTPEPKRMVQVDVAPIKIGGLFFPGGNTILPATPAPMTPLPQPVKTPDPESVRKQKEELLARDLRNVMRRRQQPASIFHARRPEKSSALIRSPEAAERDAQLRSPQSLRSPAGTGEDADGGADAADEAPATVMIASPAVMKAIRDSEARRGVQRLGNADER
ncbi:hypothetical protein BBK36DRAFT_1164297 [Trichoderma citrinoviride]|uniref:Uncharacterized protein n=1 Tax=Trichoderma citrinoviride TaxID=58853 RepID=A0A2T4BHM2_9HYPO|nr:hypothetical protein BBK36DRAFT_1164297 [Trichoderma citrinoviride]PTB68824.1 hypothetical protein BBK36DRAFT_1164297 [Trichoderma citrinoviride]